MKVKVSRKNVTDREMAKAITGLILSEGIDHDVFERLEKAQHNHTHEEIPELYIKGINIRMQRAYRSIMSMVASNIDKWTSYQSAKRMKKSFLRKADDDSKKPYLSQNQIDELSMLIEAHFRAAIGISLGVPVDVLKQWSKADVEMPDDDLLKWIKMSYVAGRLSDVLKNSSTYEEMRKKVGKLPLSRIDILSIQAAKDHCAQFVKGYAERASSLAENVALEHNRKLINAVMQGYFTGEIKQTTRNDEGLTPEEIDKLNTDIDVNGWRELATELKNRFKTQDSGRDWDRIARTEIRYATNMGRLNEIQIEGGGDPDNIEVYYHVQPEACRYCKTLYLEPDGTPKIFKLSEILANVSKTGGMNAGRKASLIGESGGWVPNAVAHPNCLVGSMRVLTDDVLATSVRRYEGDVITIVTASGKKLTCTPNHPILTDRGWIVARLLDVGSNVISSRIGEWPVSAVDVNDKNVPPSIHEVVESFRHSSEMSTIPMEVTTEDFHGDGMDSDIAIVNVNRQLLSKIETTHSKCVSNLFFKIGDTELPVLSCNSTFNHRFMRKSVFMNSVMRWFSKFEAFFYRHMLHSVKLCGRTISTFNTIFNKTLSNNNSTNVQISSNFQNGFATDVSLNDIMDRDVLSVVRELGFYNFDSSTIQMAENCNLSDTELSSQIRNSSSSVVFLDQVVDIESSSFSGQVYNLQTTKGFFVAEGIITHNCHCYPTRLIQGLTPSEFKKKKKGDD